MRSISVRSLPLARVNVYTLLNPTELFQECITNRKELESSFAF